MVKKQSTNTVQALKESMPPHDNAIFCWENTSSQAEQGKEMLQGEDISKFRIRCQGKQLVVFLLNFG